MILFIWIFFPQILWGIDMSIKNHRILLHITMLPGNDPVATKKADATYYRFNNILNGIGQFPNLSDICNFCDGINKELGAYIRNRCLDIKKEDTVFEPRVSKSKSILGIVESSERKYIRILLYPGKRDDIDDLTMEETTHNMIVQFKEVPSRFCAAEPHTNPPSFYQTCASEEMALRYLEALLIDACICHYLGVSEVASHHDEKQHISSEKVLFLRELSQKRELDFLSPSAQQLVKYVASKIDETTPYISFLSIFTIAPFDVLDGEDFHFFEDYFNLWYEFQKWYFDKHGRVFSKQKPIENPLDMVLDRNKYQGQISPAEFVEKIRELQEKPICRVRNAPFGEELRFAVIIVKHVPDKSAVISQFDALLTGKLHQSKWDIIYWDDLKRYKDVLPYLDIVPIMII